MAVSAVVPYYHPLEPDLILDHYRALMDAFGADRVLAYCIPSHSNNVLDADGLATLAREGLAGFKDSTMSADDHDAYVRALRRVERAAICGSDVHAWDGALASTFDIDLPIVLGHETVGRVVAIGEGAELDAVGRPLAIGDRVIWAHAACGRCHECTVMRTPTLCPNREIGFLQSAEQPPHFHGGFAEYAYVPPRSGRLRVPDDVKS